MYQSLFVCPRYSHDAPSLIGEIYTYLNNYEVITELLKEIFTKHNQDQTMEQLIVPDRESRNVIFDQGLKG